MSRILKVVLDGSVLVPLLTSITYFARWDDEGLDRGCESVAEIDCSDLDAVSR
jgi:hypothetical protein